ncbi:winged helix-turn-helix transcriptional regulator [Ancylobacter sp. WKF20]|uniref:winged helix-turn-helix transcriptional regulator n=1 Tax=Ancylobacter sp. WKF20 TaxID=3039801 RepID=UPI0024342EB4|nr:winged helix-turn-helix transcriptional regulator [Ancylobacter sp. WKF20]WGD31635.1 winged helix-turn-helix transcriptional regulator [Ancylobacter sp. WKF20]
MKPEARAGLRNLVSAVEYFTKQHKSFSDLTLQIFGIICAEPDIWQGDLTKRHGIARNTVSTHLKWLTECGLVRSQPAQHHANAFEWRATTAGEAVAEKMAEIAGGAR